MPYWFGPDDVLKGTLIWSEHEGSGTGGSRGYLPGAVTVDSMARSTKVKPGDAVWSGPRELHSVENVGESVLRVIGVEIKGE